MARLSPHEQATSEYRLRSVTTVLYLLVVGVVICVAYWIVGPDRSPDLATPSEQVDESTASSNTAGPDSSTAVATAALSEQVQTLQHKLATGSTERSALASHLAVLAQRLRSADLRPSEVAEVEHRLADLQERASLYRAQSQRPTVKSDSLLSTVNSMALKLTEDEQHSESTAIADAKQKTRDEFETEVRAIRLELRDSQDQISRLQQQIQHEQREQRQQRAKAKRQQALADDMEDVRKYLRPFTTPGHLQPKVDSNPWNTERTVEAQPVSLSKLQQAGALDKTLEGLERLYIFGGGKNPGLHNRRPLGAFPEYAANRLHKPQVRDPVQRAQELLIQHGEALVEQQLLSP